MKHKEIFAIGSYTEVLDHVPNGCGEGIYLVELDSTTGKLAIKATLKGIKNPSYLFWDNKNCDLYSVSESEKDKPVLYKVKLKDQEMTITDWIVENSSSPCHITKHKDRVFTASYQFGSTTVFNASNGLELIKVTPYTGSGPNKIRQDKPHAHQVVLDAENSRYFVSDLGSDKIWIHDLNSSKILGGIDTPSGFGPRHLLVNKNDIYVLCELEPVLLHYKNIGELEFKLETKCNLYIEDGYIGKNAPAAIKIHQSGKTLYCANRFRDKISIFNIDTELKKPILINEIDCFGKTPRDFTFSNNGDWLIILNQDSSDIITLKIDVETGIPIASKYNKLDIKTPVCAVSIS